MKLSQLLTILLFLSANSLFSQTMDLENVTLEQLSQKEHQIDKNATAAILFKKAKTKFKYHLDKGYESFTEFDVKIKIFKKEGLKWANFQIPYYVGYDKVEDDLVNIVKAYSYNVVNGQIVKEKVSGVGKVEQNVNDYWKTMTVLFPNVKEGSIVEIKYVLKSHNIGVLPDFQFQYTIPVDFAEYITEIPEFFLYKGMRNGNIPVEMKETIEDDLTAFTNKYEDPSGFKHKKIKSIYTIKNIPALVEEGFVSNINNYFGKIEHELQTMRKPNDKLRQISKTWSDVALSIYGMKEFGKEIEKKSYYADDLKKLITDADSEKEKLDKVFKFVQGKMNWNHREGYIPRKPLSDAYKEKTGNAAEINLILISMLRTSGLVANPVLLSTRDNGIALFPNSSKINFVLAVVDIGTERFLLDATNKFSRPNLIPVNDLNWIGQSIKKDGQCAEIDLMPKMISKESTNLIATLAADGTFSGKIRNLYFDYHALGFRETKGKSSAELNVSRLEDTFKGVLIDDYKIENNEDVSKPIVEFYSFKKEGFSEVIGDKIYFSPLGFIGESVNPFRQEERVYPVDFVFPSQKKMMITIDLPEGYVVESLPQALNLVLSDKVLSYKFMIADTGKQIQLTSIFDINTSIISPEDYEELKKFFAEMIKKQTEKVVLKKA
jgi:hypothetical protein